MNKEPVNNSQDTTNNSDKTESSSKKNISQNVMRNMMGMNALKDAMKMGLFNKSKKSKVGITKTPLHKAVKVRRRRNKAAHKSRMKNYKLVKIRSGKKIFKTI